MAKPNLVFGAKIPTPKEQTKTNGANAFRILKQHHMRLLSGNSELAVYLKHRKAFLREHPTKANDLLRVEEAHSRSFRPGLPRPTPQNKVRVKKQKRFKFQRALAPERRKKPRATPEAINRLVELGMPLSATKGLTQQTALTLIGRLLSGSAPLAVSKPREMNYWQMRKLNSEPREATETEAKWLKNHLTGPYGNERKK